MNIQVEGNIPIFVTRNLVMFPGILSPILVGRKPTLALVKYLEENPNAIIAVVSQKDSNVNDPNEGDIYNIGVYARLYVPLICLDMRITIGLLFYKDLEGVK